MATEIRRVKITSDGTGSGTRVKDAVTGEDVGDCYAFDIRASRMSAVLKTMLYCYAPIVDLETDAEVVEVPHSLRKRAREILRTTDSAAVRSAFADLLGITETSKSPFGSNVCAQHEQ